MQTHCERIPTFLPTPSTVFPGQTALYKSSEHPTVFRALQVGYSSPHHPDALHARCSQLWELPQSGCSHPLMSLPVSSPPPFLWFLPLSPSSLLYWVMFYSSSKTQLEYYSVPLSLLVASFSHTLSSSERTVQWRFTH